MAIEEQIRDTKGARFGFALVWTQITTPESLARFVVLIGLAVLLLTAVGHALSQKHTHVRLPSKTKGPRLSLLISDNHYSRTGIMLDVHHSVNGRPSLLARPSK